MTTPITSASIPRKLAVLDAAELLNDRLVAVALPPADLTLQALHELQPRDILFLERNAPELAERHRRHVTLRYRSTRSVAESNCTAAILHGTAVQAAMSPKVLARFDLVLVPQDWTLFLSAPALVRHTRRGRLAYRGKTRIATRTYLVLDCPVRSKDNRRQYGTAGREPLEVLRKLDGLDYVVLRWPEAIETGEHEGDIDILVAAPDAPKVAERYADSVATWPLDVYSDDGSSGYFFAQAPYFKPAMARRILGSAITRPSGLRTPDDRWRFLSFAYHLMLHIKSRRIPPGTETIGPATFRSGKYFAELTRLAKAAGEAPPMTFGQIEEALRRADGWPSIDLLGFYAEKNRFLKHRYFERSAYQPGLMTLFVRDFGAATERVAAVREMLTSRFEILAEGPVTDALREQIENGVRGGNWSDPTAPGGIARPVFWFVCLDRTPRRPKARTRKKRPRFDNENINIKHGIRLAVGDASLKEQRIIHTSDNTAEAIEHLSLLGLAAEPGIQQVIRALHAPSVKPAQKA